MKKWLLTQIDFEGYDVTIPTTDKEKIKLAFSICRNEVGHIEQREGTHKMVEYWLSGLCSVISLPYLYIDIIKTAKQFCEFTEQEEEKLCSNWFNYCAVS